MLADVSGILGLDEPIFCAVDEAQIPMQMLKSCFRSSKNPDTPRPLLSSLLAAVIEVVPNLIISGTGMSLAVIKEILPAAMARENKMVDWVKNLGTFDTEKQQRLYMECYLPKGLLDTDSWKLVLSRASYWLRGQ